MDEYCKDCGILLTGYKDNVPSLTSRCVDTHDGGNGDIVCFWCLDHRTYPYLHEHKERE